MQLAVWLSVPLLTFLPFCMFPSGHMVPYNVPSSSMDMLKRFLTGKPFIDEELPQVRYSDKPDKQKKHKGAEKWMNTPDYPKLPKDRNAAGASYYSLTGFPSFETNMLEGTASFNPQNTAGFASGSGMAFLAGVVASFVVMKLVNRWSQQRQQGYQAVPEASLDE